MNDTVTLPEVTEAKPSRELNRYHDRCQKCGAQAFYIAQKPRTEPAPHAHVDDKDNDELAFCAHHGKKFMPGLVSQGWNVLDFTHMLNEKPSVSANAD